MIGLLGKEVRIDHLAYWIGWVGKVTLLGSGPDLIARFAAMGGCHGDGAAIGKREGPRRGAGLEVKVLARLRVTRG